MDFDVKRRERQDQLTEEFGDHEFTLGGEQFRIRRIIPFAALAKLTGVSASKSTNADAFQTAQEVVLSMIAAGPKMVEQEDDPPREETTQEARQRFLDVVYDTDSDYPVTYIELLEVQEWMIEEASGRPPTQPESSSEPPSTNGTNATATSSEPQAAV